MNQETASITINSL